MPPLAKGDYAVTVTARRKDVNDGQALVPIDPGIPLFAIRVSPKNPLPGQSVKMTLRGLVAIEEGDSLVFEDGYKIVLPKPARCSSIELSSTSKTRSAAVSDRVDQSTTRLKFWNGW